MRNIQKTKKSGFTLLEVIIVIVILAILASIAVPRYTRSLEKSRAAEGTYFLGTLLSSMERYFLEKGNFPAGQIFNAGTGLDIDVPTLKYFDSGTIELHQLSCTLGTSCARIMRSSSPPYKLFIARDGTITCTPTGSQECSDAGY